MSLYWGKVLCAPMVRVSHLPFRMCCAAHGADVVFSEELVAAKLQHCVHEERLYPSSTEPNAPQRVVDEFVVYEAFRHSLKRSIVFATIRGGEGSPVIVQLGAADPVVAAKAALVVCDYVDGIDVNMGCPKKFSVQNHMGAALMSDPVRAGKILRSINEAVNSEAKVALRNGRRVPISFKTRLFDRPEKSVTHLSTVLAEAGGPAVVHAITLHCRTRDMRSEAPPLLDLGATVVALLREKHAEMFQGFCFVLNGSVACRRTGLEAAQRLGFNAIMMARHAMWDPRSFSADYSRDKFEDTDADELAAVHLELMRRHVALRTAFQFVKFHVTRSFQELSSALGKDKAKNLSLAKNYSETASILNASAESVATTFNVEFVEELVAENPHTVVPCVNHVVDPVSSEEPLRKHQRCEVKESSVGADDPASPHTTVN